MAYPKQVDTHFPLGGFGRSLFEGDDFAVSPRADHEV